MRPSPKRLCYIKSLFPKTWFAAVVIGIELVVDSIVSVVSAVCTAAIV